MNELVRRIVEDNLAERKNKLAEIDIVVAEVETKKAEYDEALAKLSDLGDVLLLKERLTSEIEEIENELFPSSDDDCSEFVADVAVATEEIAE